MSESAEDKLTRVQSMVNAGWIWNLSPDDIAALKHVLAVMRALAGRLGQFTGFEAQATIEKFSTEVQNEQAKD